MHFEHVKHDLAIPYVTRETTNRGRYYTTPEGNSYPSITTILGATSNSDGLTKWRQWVGEEEADRISRKATTRGTKIHKYTEDMLNNVPGWNKNMNVFERSFYKKFQVLLEQNISNVWAQEIYLYSDTLKLAGQVDCVADWDGVLSIIDFKTASRRKTESMIGDYFLQGTFYACAFYEMFKIPVRQVVIAICVDADDPQIFKITPDMSRIKELYRRRKTFG